MTTGVKLIAIGYLLSAICLSAFAQGTAFTYQGQLQNNGSPASGTYNLTFTLFNTNITGVPVAGPVTNNAVAVTNGLFTVLIDFGPGVWNGETNWLEIGVETNGASPFTTLAPRQQLTPTPYAIYAEGVPASGIIGTLVDAQLTHSDVTVNPGPGLSGGGKVGLGNTIILTNTGVLSVTGNADITAAPSSGAVTLGDTATSADTPNLIVKRDGSGSFSAATITLDGNLNLPSTAVSPDIIYSGTSLLLYADNSGNFFTGQSAGNPATIGFLNTADGFKALANNTSGFYNTAVGNSALYSNTSGSDNTANGRAALTSNTSGSDNTANGFNALFYNTGGNYNTANGASALQNNTNGSDNTANGAYALYNNTSGGDNTANGEATLFNNTDGSYNTADGYLALFANTDGSYNTANGSSALEANTSGYANTADGYSALFHNTNGAYNTAIGYTALNNNESGGDDTAVGVLALYSNTSGDDNTAIGAAALYHNTSGYQNTAIGEEAVYYLTNGNYNTAIGYVSLYNLLTGSNNIALGYQAGFGITTGGNNIDIGNFGNSSDNNIIRLGSSQTATYIAGVIYGNGGGLTGLNASQLIGTVANSQLANSSITVNAGTGLSGGGAVVLGGSTTLNNTGVTSLTGGGGVTVSASSGSVTLGSTATSADTVNAIVSRDGSGNFSAGSITLAGTLTLPAAPVTIYSGGVGLVDADSSDNFFAGLGAGPASSGGEDTGVGYDALNISTGFHNSGIGYQALYLNSGGSYNVVAGSQALFSNSQGSNNVAVGYQAGYHLTTGSSNIDIGNLGVAGEANIIRIGSGQTKTFIAGISGATAASGVAVYVNSFGQLGTLISSRRFKDDIQGMDQASAVLYALKPVTFKYKPGIDPQGIPQFGLVAEDVEKVAPDLVAHDGQGKIYTVRYQAVDAMLLNEFLKEHRRVEEQSGEIETLKAKAAKVDALEKRLAELEQAVQSLAEKK